MSTSNERNASELTYGTRRLNRRAALAAGLFGWSGLTFASRWGLPAHAESPLSKAPRKNRSLILLWQDGGPSHFETFDPKPDAPSEYRGELGAISTALPGVAYCQVLPRLAQLADRTVVIRSLHQPSSDHVVGSHNVLTGWYDQTSGGRSRYPDLASVISHLRSGVEDTSIAIGSSTDPRLARGMRGSAGNRDRVGESFDLPRYIDLGLGLHRGGPAFLGAVAGPFQVAGDPSKPGFTIQNLESSLSPDRLTARGAMLNDLDRLAVPGSALLSANTMLRSVDAFRQQAFELVMGGAGARAFDVSREPTSVRERYGLHLAGQQCLLARRLVEAGASVVAVRFSPDGRGDYDRTMIGWDDHAVHGNIFSIMRQRGPQFDQSVSALIEDLERRGLRDDVLLVVVGEFGRTPRVHVHKGCPGREHWGPAGCALLYGGGLEMGQIIGSTNHLGESPQDRPVTYQDLLATIYTSLGIPLERTFVDEAGRPTPLLPAGRPIRELFGGSGSAPRGSTRVEHVRSSGASPTADSPTITLPPDSTDDDLRRRADRGEWPSLALHETRVDDRGLAELAECAALRRLLLNGLPITDAGLRPLSRLTNLEELGLAGTRVTDAGLSQLGSLRHLRSLSIQGTAITLSGVVRLIVQEQGRSLIDALSALGLVRFDERARPVAVDVAGTTFGDDELRCFGTVPSLRELHFAATRVTDQGLEALAPHASLERLFLAKCEITDAGLRSVVRHPRLQSLNLVGTKITSAGLESLAELQELRTLFVTDLKLSPAAVDALKQRLPQLTVSDFTPA